MARTGGAADRGDGTTVRRVVLVADEQRRAIEPMLTADERNVTLPRRTGRLVLDLDPPPATTLRTVRANGRVVLHDPDGLTGSHEVRVSRFASATLHFDASGPLPRGSVRVVSFPARITKGVLEVTVDA